MIWSVALISLIAGVAIGYRLPATLAWWRRYRYRQSFKPIALRPYRPATAENSGRVDAGHLAP